jgi:hypothetical protein
MLDPCFKEADGLGKLRDKAGVVLDKSSALLSQEGQALIEGPAVMRMMSK